jgi:hypothetical protein
MVIFASRAGMDREIDRRRLRRSDRSRKMEACVDELLEALEEMMIAPLGRLVAR